MLFRLFCFLACFASIESFAANNPADLDISPPEKWIQPYKLPRIDKIPDDRIKNGIYYLLVDEQLQATRTGEPRYYFHLALKVVNQIGLQDSAQINITFDPSYQKLSIHSVTIHRNQSVINGLTNAKVSTLQREEELENSIYNGSYTTNILINDLRVGDIVEYSYTMTGDNPIHAGAFYYRFSTQWSVPLKKLYYRLVWDKTTEPRFLEINTSLKPKVTATGSTKEYIYEDQDTSVLNVNSETPEWYSPYGRVYISDMPSWEAVINWAHELYHQAIDTEGEIARIADTIKNEHPNQDDQVVAALKITQTEIRYLGIETGENSHKPSPANETWSRRYGDCKDKTVFFISLLNRLAINAYPALVNTNKPKDLHTRLPAATAFDHVITKVILGKKSYWLDPTRSMQAGKLDNLHQANYGHALVIKPGLTELEAITYEDTSRQVIDEFFDLTGAATEPVAYTVKTKYYGRLAETQRAKIASTNINSTSTEYINFYKDYYPDIEASANISHKDTPDTNQLEVTENYSIPNAWKPNETDNSKHYLYLYGSIIETNIHKPEEPHRNSPFAIKYPNEIIQHIHAKVTDDWGFLQEVVTEDNEFFNYKSDIKYDEKTKTLHLIYSYKAKKDHVPADKIDAYIAARKRVMDDISYTVQTTPNTNDLSEIDDIYIYTLLAIIYLIPLTYAIINWRRDHERRTHQNESVYYAVGLLKFWLLSFFTFGIYMTYWFWMNWRHIKHIDKSDIVPWGRAFFHGLWFYSFYASLTFKHPDNKTYFLPRSSSLAIILSILYFIALFSYNSKSVSVEIVALIVSTFIASLALIQINKLQQETPGIQAYNSRFRLRDFAILICSAPIVFISISTEIGLTPNPRVVDGDKLWPHTIHYMSDHRIIAKDEKIQKFFSAALFDMRNDGNGFTQDRVFSYWRDDGALSYESILLSKVKEVEFSKEEDNSGNTVIKIHPEEGETFLLYVPKKEKDDETFYKALLENWKKNRIKFELAHSLPDATQRISLKKTGAYQLLEKTITQAYTQDDYGHANFVMGELYEKGTLVKQDHQRAEYFYTKALQGGHKSAGANLSWMLSVTTDDEVKDPVRALEIIKKVIKKADTLRNKEILAAAYAANDDFEKSIAIQKEIVATTKGKNIVIATQRLDSYLSHNPWSEKYPTSIADMNALPLIKIPAKYPHQALQKGIEGIVVVQYDVLADGSTSNIKVIEADPTEYFDTESINAAKYFKYFPRIDNGVPAVAHGVKNKFTFEMKN